jgi:hypothetical protein
MIHRFQHDNLASSNIYISEVRKIGIKIWNYLEITPETHRRGGKRGLALESSARVIFFDLSSSGHSTANPASTTMGLAGVLTWAISDV